jgi:hypothetical protein
MKNISIPIPIGSVVSHKSQYGMQQQSGIVLDDAGIRYGRHYVWVGWVIPGTEKSYRAAFWESVLIKTSEPLKIFIERTAKSMTYVSK